jgi:hypothetical protein
MLQPPRQNQGLLSQCFGVSPDIENAYDATHGSMLRKMVKNVSNGPG